MTELPNGVQASGPAGPRHVPQSGPGATHQDTEQRPPRDGLDASAVAAERADGTDLFDGDTGTASPQVRAVLTAVLADRVLLGDRKPQVWRVLTENEAAIRSFLHNIYLDLVVNHEKQVAFKRQVYTDTEHRTLAPRVLLPARNTSVEFAAGVLLLVEECRRAHFTGTTTVQVTRAAFNEAFDVLWGTGVTNLSARSRNGNASIKALNEEGLLMGPKDGDQWDVSPAVQVLYGPAEIARLAAALTATDLEVDDDLDPAGDINTDHSFSADRDPAPYQDQPRVPGQAADHNTGPDHDPDTAPGASTSVYPNTDSETGSHEEASRRE